MFDIFETFLGDVVGSIWDVILSSTESIIENLMRYSLKIELLSEALLTGNPITQTVISSIYSFMYATMCGVLGLAFLYKGFKVYILWRDGDSEISPQGMVVGSIWAIIMAVAFPYLYDILVDLVLYIADGVVGGFRIGTTPSGALVDLVAGILLEGLPYLIFFLIFIVLMLVVFCKLLCRGVELMFLRLGFPLVCINLVNSDGNLFRQYTELFFKQAALSVIQIVCLLLSLYVMTNIQLVNIIFAVVLQSCALSAPKIMAQLLPVTGGGGNRLSTAAMLIRTVIKV